MTTMYLAVLAISNVLCLVVNVGSMIWREHRMRKLRRELDELAPLIGFVAALADDQAENVPPRLRALARDVLPAWADPRPAQVRPFTRRMVH